MHRSLSHFLRLRRYCSNALFFKIKITAKKATGALISLVGVFSIIGVANGTIGISIGDLYVLGAMLCLSISLLFIRALSKTMNSYIITVFATVLGSVLMIPAAGVEGLVGRTVVSGSPFLWFLLIAAGILAQGIAGFWWNKGVSVVGAGTASMFMNLQPFVAILASHFILGNPIQLGQILGGCLVLCGVFIANLPALKASIPIESQKSA